MTIDYHRTPMIQFRPDAELYAAIEAHQRPGESLNQTAKRLVQEAISTRRSGKIDEERDRAASTAGPVADSCIRGADNANSTTPRRYPGTH